MRLQVETEADGFLVLTDTYMPGWRATINGKSTEILRANYAFRAVRIPAGHHDVEFNYQPLSFQIGAYVSVIGSVLWFACFMTLRGNRNRYAASPPRFADLSPNKSANPINPVP